MFILATFIVSILYAMLALAISASSKGMSERVVPSSASSPLGTTAAENKKKQRKPRPKSLKLFALPRYAGLPAVEVQMEEESPLPNRPAPTPTPALTRTRTLTTPHLNVEPIIHTPSAPNSIYDDPCCHRARIFSPLNPRTTKASPHTPSATVALNHLRQTLDLQLGQPLPSNWQIRLSSNRRIYFVDMKNGTTQWSDPRLVPCSSPLGEKANGTITQSDGKSRLTRWIRENQRQHRLMNLRRTRARSAKVERRIEPLGNMVNALMVMRSSSRSGGGGDTLDLC